MNKTYKEQYKEQTDIEKGLGLAWGYKLVNTPIGLEQKKTASQKRPVVANITPRKFGKEAEKSEKMKQVEEQLKALENQRILRQMKEGQRDQPALSEKSQIIKLMQKVISNYNHIVEHRHLIKPEKQYSQERMHHEVSEEKKLLEQINERKKMMLKADLSQQIKINKEIAQLYRKFQSNQDSVNSIPSNSKNRSNLAQDQVSASKDMKKYQSQTFSKLGELSVANLNKFMSLKLSNSEEQLQEMSQFVKHQSFIQGNEAQMIKKFKELQFKRYNKVRKQSTYFENPMAQAKKNKSMEKEIASPYLEKKQMEEFKQMEIKIRNNSEALEIWRNKITDATQNSRLAWQKQHAEKMQAKKQAETSLAERQEELEEILGKSIKIIDFQPTSTKNIFTQQLKQKQQQHQVEKQQIFSELLRKKNSKFNKLWGTRILVKYDPQEEAKLLLKGAGDKRPRGKSSATSFTRTPSKHLDYSQQITPIKNQQSNKSQEELILRAEQKDQEHYWRMCKNQKINLLLKRR